MRRKLLLTIFMVFLTGSFSYWGVIPDVKHAVQLEYKQTGIDSLKITIAPHPIGQLMLDVRINSQVVSKGARRHDVFRNTREEHILNTKCHYHGSISSVPDSLVILSNCSGTFRGSISGLNDTNWYLVYDNGTYVMFLESSVPESPEMATLDFIKDLPGYSDNVRNSTLREKRATKIASKETKKLIIEIVIATDVSLFRQFNSKIEDMEEFVLSTAYHVDTIYQKIGMRLALIGMENWRTEDKISVTPVAGTLLKTFRSYRQDTLLAEFKQHDSSVFMSGVDFSGPTVGMAGVGTICTSSCCNVNSNTRSAPKFFGGVIAHELGHNLGLSHDRSDEGCACPPDSSNCIMSSSIGSNPPTLFSDCSIAFLQSEEFVEEDSHCLTNIPDVLYGAPVCGNGFVEEGEECDCGTFQECLSSDPCCEPVGCKLKVGAECYTGDCCQDCRFLHYKKPCRAASSECDLVEFCNGTHAQCPSNQVYQDGTKCASGEGYCNYGNCLTRDNQCVVTWGANVSADHVTWGDACYTQLNGKGNKFGNCGEDENGKYIACAVENLLCGKLFCIVPDDRDPKFSYLTRMSASIAVVNDSLKCVTSRRKYYSVSDTDNALVYDGTKCGDDQWCMSGECAEFRRAGCPAPGGVECGGHGSCNDLNECHCHAGYDPLSNCAALLRVAALDTKKILIAVSAIVLLVIPLLIVGLLLLRRYNPRVKAVMDRKTHIRFSVRLPSMSRRGSSLRNTRPPKEGDKTKKIPPARPVKLPDSESGPARPPGSYKTSSGWSTSSYNQTQPTSAQNQYTSYSDKPSTSSWDSSDEETHPFHPTSSQPGPSKPVPVRAAPARPVRPAPTFNEIPESQSDDTTNSLYIPQSTGISSSYSPLKMRPSPTRPPAISRDPATRSTEENARVKLDISGPESARKLINDSPLDDRRLAGSTLKDVQR